MTNRLKNIVVLLSGLTSVIVVHELGHFLICKLFHVSTPVFSVGFGPTLFGYKIGSTFFQFALLPLGGYVAIDPTSFAAIPYIQKVLINVAGVSFNVTFAFILFSILLYMISKKQTTTIINKIEKNSPADRAKLNIGDVITAYNNSPLKNSTQDSSISTFLEHVRRSPGMPLTLDIERRDTHMTVQLITDNNHPALGPNLGFLGIHFEQIEGRPAAFHTVIAQSITTTSAILRRLAQITFGLFKKENRDALAGPIGIVTSIENPEPYLFFSWLALMNLNVAFFNILPFPFLDGGHIAQNTIEALYGQPLPPAFMQAVNLIFLFLFIWFIIHISIRDIKKIRQKNSPS